MSPVDAQTLYLQSDLGENDCDSCFLYQALSSLVTILQMSFF